MTIHDATEVAYKNGYAAGKRDAVADILSPTDATKGIPVTERLPKEDGSYLVYTARGSGKILLTACKNYLKTVVDAAPTIDPEELRPKGRWVRKEDSECYWFECSECGEQPLKRYKYDCFSDYCPHCGADMRGENNGKE